MVHAGFAGTEAPVGSRIISVDIAIPVLNEERALPGCISTLRSFLHSTFPFCWRITIVDNGSTDETWNIASRLAEQLPEVHAYRLGVRGKGAAVKAAWRESPAEIVVYMDVDLSTGLPALLPLVAGLATEHCDLAIGTRLTSGSRISRGLKRELISRGYNLLLRRGFGARFTDATCGFKAARTGAVRSLLESISDDGWFFDTELLLLAQFHGLRIHEVPVDWIEDVDSRVHVARTAFEDLRGLLRVSRAIAAGRALAPVPRPRDPRPAHPDALVAQARTMPPVLKYASFGMIGAVSTLAHGALYAVLRLWWPVAGANLAALALIGICNTEANRRWTFNRSGGPRVRLHLRAALVFAVGFLFTTGTVVTLHSIFPALGRVAEITALICAYFVTTLTRFIVLDRWVFVHPSRPR